ncbi:MAG: tRNA (adenosine(37)-N6)-threonylcarbamoyltransferase complex ATPase subunit type 1 TsaE [Candidatus Cloacimonetes bacterium]|nr:tRNA (adenosine(37)-N6)-threonylcarbamoyltransferase complex ATPase subunit type 1 TsaE [Candidatus Cloacimonadota bacterium]
MNVTKCEQETIDYAIAFAKRISAPALLLLEGDLGAGKTCFVRGLCEGLGGDPGQVSSPTFAIMQEYDVANNLRLVHIDAYRLSGEEELESIGWDELLEEENTIIAIEWPSRIANAIPEHGNTVQIAHIDLHSREITIK